MAEAYSWRWAFYVLVPVGLVSIVTLRLTLQNDNNSKPAPLDWIGFASLSVSLSAIQYALSRGQRLDWFDSTEIRAATLIAIVSLWIFSVHCMTCDKPFLSPRLLMNRNYAIGLLLVMIYGMLNFTPMVLLPTLLTTYAGYTDSLVGLVVAGRGVGGCIGFLFAGLASRMDSRLSMFLGFSMLLVAGWWLMHVDLNITAIELMANAMLQGLAIGLIWVPLTTTAFASIAKEDMAQATAIYHLLRNLGSSLFIAICVSEIVRSTTVNYGRMAEFISPFNKSAMATLPPAWGVETIGGLARLSREVVKQSALLGYLNAFGLFTLACAATLPMIVLMRARSQAR